MVVLRAVAGTATLNIRLCNVSQTKPPRHPKTVGFLPSPEACSEITLGSELRVWEMRVVPDSQQNKQVEMQRMAAWGISPLSTDLGKP